MKKIISTLLAMVMLLGAVAAMGISVSAAPEGIAINNAEELLALATQCDSGSFSGTYYLVNDIDLGGKAFGQYVFKHFNGTLDGQGHKIYNFSFNGSNATNANAGFFSWFGNSADTVVKDLQIGDETNPIVYNLKVADNGKHYSFFACEPGNNNATTSITVENVHIYAIANITTDIEAPKFNFGGLFGMTRSKENAYTVKNCSVNGEINACVALNGGGKYVNAAGFVGSQNSKASFVMEDCVNNANITTGFSTVEARAAGFITYTSQKAITLKNCVNTGNITVLGDAAGAQVAGIIGDVNGEGAELIGCINAGEISGCQWAAGMIANVRDGKTATITDCTNYGTISTATVASPSVAYGAASVTIAGFSDKTGTSYPETTEPPVVTDPPAADTTNPGASEPTGDSSIIFAVVALISILGIAVVAKRREN